MLFSYSASKGLRFALGAGIAFALARQLSKHRKKKATNARLAQMQHSIDELASRTHRLSLKPSKRVHSSSSQHSHGLIKTRVHSSSHGHRPN